MISFSGFVGLQFVLKNIKKPCNILENRVLFGGPERIRTAVRGFADLCLATRPQDRFVIRKAKIIKFI